MPLEKGNITEADKRLGPRTRGYEWVNGKKNIGEQYVIVDPAGTAFLGKNPKPLNKGVSGFSKALGDIICTTNANGEATRNNDAKSKFGRPTDADGNPITLLSAGDAIFNNTLAADKTLPLFVIHTRGPEFSKDPTSQDLTAKDEKKIPDFEKALTVSLTKSIEIWKNSPQTKDKKLSLPLISSGIFGGTTMGQRYYEVYLNALDAAMKANNLDAEQSKKVLVTPYLEAEAKGLSEAMEKREKAITNPDPAASATKSSTNKTDAPAIGKPAVSAVIDPAKSATTPTTKEPATNEAVVTNSTSAFPTVAAVAVPKKDVAIDDAIPSVLLRNTNIKNRETGPSNSTILSVDAKYEEEKFSENLTNVLDDIIKKWKEDETKNKSALNLSFDIQSLNAPAIKNSPDLYLKCLEEAMQKNKLSAEQAKQVNVYASGTDFEALQKNAPAEIAVEASRRLIHESREKIITIGNREELVREFEKLAKETSIENCETFLKQTAKLAKTDTSFGILHELLSKTSKLDESKNPELIKKIITEFGFLAEAKRDKPVSKFLESQQLRAALTNLAEQNQENPQFANLAQSSCNKFNEAQQEADKTIMEKMAKQEDENQASTDSKSKQSPISNAENEPNAENESTRSSTNKNPEKDIKTGKSANDFDLPQTDNVEVAKSLGKGALLITLMAVAAMYFSPAVIMIGAAAVAYHAYNKKDGSAKLSEENSDFSSQDPDANFDSHQFSKLAQGRYKETEQKDAMKGAVEDAANGLGEDLGQAKQMLNKAQEGIHSAQTIAGQYALASSASVENVPAAASKVGENIAISPERAKSEQQDADAAKAGAITSDNAAKITKDAGHAAKILHERAEQQERKGGREA